MQKPLLTVSMLLVISIPMMGPSIHAYQSNVTAHTVGPTISFVTPITSDTRQMIVIRGSGFGNSFPQTTPLGDGSIDTYSCGVSTPFLAIDDNVGGVGPESWSAGLDSCNNFDLIGIFLTSWNDTTIEIGGFGSYLGNSTHPSRWNINAGNPIVIDVTGPNNDGRALYNLVVGSTVPAKVSWSFSPSPIASPATLAATTSVIVTLTAQNSTHHPVPGATILLSSTGDLGGPHGQFFVGQLVLTTSWSAYAADSKGQVNVTYATPSQLPAGGFDAILASGTTNGDSVMIDLYNFSGSFQLFVTSNGLAYDLEFIVDASRYHLPDSPGGFPYGQESNYVTHYIADPNSYPIYGVSVRPAFSSFLVPKDQRSSLVFKTLSWAWEYYQYKTGNLGNFQGLNDDYRAMESVEWLQKLSIGAVDVANLLTVVLPTLAADLAAVPGSFGNDQIINILSLIDDIVHGPSQLSNARPSRSNQILTTLESDGLIVDSQYDGSEVLYNLANLTPQQDWKIIGDLYGSAYSSTPDISLQNHTVDLIQALGGTVKNNGEKAALAAIVTFVNTYFRYQLTLSTSSLASATELSATFKGGFTSLTVAQLVDQFLIQNYLLPMAYLQQEQVNIQDAAYYKLFPTLYSDFSNMMNGVRADVDRGPSAFYAEGLIFAFTSLWYYVDSKLQAQVPLSAGLVTGDTSASTQFANAAFQTSQNLESLQQEAAALTKGLDPGPLDFSGLLLNAHLRSRLTSFPQNHVIFLVAPMRTNLTIEFNGYLVKVEKILAKSTSTYQYTQIAEDGSGNHTLIIAGAPTTELFVQSSENSRFTLYEAKQGQETLLLTTQLDSPKVSAISIDASSQDSTTATDQGHTITFTQTVLARGTNWTITFAGNIFSWPTNQDFIIQGLPDGTYNFEIATSAGQGITPRSGTILVHGEDVTIRVTTPQLPSQATSTPLFLFGGIGGLAALAILGVAAFVLRKRNTSQREGAPAALKKPV